MAIKNQIAANNSNYSLTMKKQIIMKKRNFIVGIMTIIGVVTLVSCKKSNDPLNENMDGIYYGCII